MNSLDVWLCALAILIAAVFLAGCSSEEAVTVPRASAEQVTVLDSAQGKALIDAEKKVVVIDARPRGEYMSGHLVGAQSIDVTDAAAWNFRTSGLDPDLPTVLYCSAAPCSQQAAEKLLALGFTQVYDLGGIWDWNPKDLSVEKPEG